MAGGQPVERRDGDVAGPWCLLWYRLKGYADKRQLDAVAAARADGPESDYYRALTDAYADIMRFMNEMEAVLERR